MRDCSPSCPPRDRPFRQRRRAVALGRRPRSGSQTAAEGWLSRSRSPFAVPQLKTGLGFLHDGDPHQLTRMLANTNDENAQSSSGDLAQEKERDFQHYSKIDWRVGGGVPLENPFTTQARRVGQTPKIQNSELMTSLDARVPSAPHKPKGLCEPAAKTLLAPELVASQ